MHTLTVRVKTRELAEPERHALYRIPPGSLSHAFWRLRAACVHACTQRSSPCRALLTDRLQTPMPSRRPLPRRRRRRRRIGLRVRRPSLQTRPVTLRGRCAHPISDLTLAPRPPLPPHRPVRLSIRLPVLTSLTLSDHRGDLPQAFSQISQRHPGIYVSYVCRT